MLHVDTVSCIRQERCLFTDIEFTLAPGQIMQLEGPNGAGKTSLLRIIAGFVEPHSGVVRWNGEAVSSQREQFADDLLFIGHKTGVNTQMSAIENLDFWLATHGCSSGQDHFSLLAKLGLVGLEDVPVRNLSAGQQRRVALARLWHSRARLWLLDEPFTAVDKKGVVLLQQQFQHHLSGGGSILLTSHQDLTEQFGELKTLALEYRH